jgi:hypothetical protein
MKPKVSVKQRNQRLDQTEVRLLEFFNNYIISIHFVFYNINLVLNSKRIQGLRRVIAMC